MLKILKLTQRDIATKELFDQLIANGISLIHVELGLAQMNGSVAESIAKMQSIRILGLNEMAGVNESHVTSLAKQLKSLKELHVKTYGTISVNGIKDIVRAAERLSCLKLDANRFVFNVETYEAVLAIIQERKAQIKLELTIYGDGNQLAVPSDILNGPNEKWLKLNELNRCHHHLFEDLKSKVGNPPPRPTYSRYSDSDDSDYYWALSWTHSRINPIAKM